MNNNAPEIILKNLMLLFPHAYNALDHGVFKAKEFFETLERKEDQAIDSHLAAHIVRFHATCYLKRVGQDAYEENLSDVNLAKIPNTGIHINYGRYQIKVLKSNQGNLPVPGYSKSRQVFYDQPSLSLFENDDSSIIKLLLLWNVKKEYSGLDMLSLACPKSGSITRDSVENHFHCKIPTKLLYGHCDINEVIKPEDIFDLPLGEINLDETGTY